MPIRGGNLDGQIGLSRFFGAKKIVAQPDTKSSGLGQIVGIDVWI